jgi:hypothetical protein
LPNLKIDEIIKIEAENVPEGSVFKGYSEYTVQELVSRVHVTKYHLAQWQTPEGNYFTADLPKEIQGWHFGPGLRQYIFYQHHYNRVTQGKIFKDLEEKGIAISRGEIDRILIEIAKSLEQEKKDILKAGIATAQVLQADDTGNRKMGKNVFSTIICNDFFAYFHTSDKKNRINFLEILRGESTSYAITKESVEYAKKQKLQEMTINLLASYINTTFSDEKALKAFFKGYKFTQDEIRTITEGALIGTLINQGVPNDIVILSDDAGQFNLFEHALCWIHAERHIRKIIPINESDRTEIDHIRDLIWKYYQELKAYKINPTSEQKELLLQKFEKIFTTKVTCNSLQKALSSIYKNKKELLVVLDKPFTPLHNNTSEQNIRDLVIKRKVSGGSQSNDGCTARDIANSLIQTCHKLQVSFWQFLMDRISMKKQIQYLPKIIREKANRSVASPS